MIPSKCFPATVDDSGELTQKILISAVNSPFTYTEVLTVTNLLELQYTGSSLPSGVSSYLAGTKDCYKLLTGAEVDVPLMVSVNQFYLKRKGYNQLSYGSGVMDMWRYMGEHPLDIQAVLDGIQPNA